MKLAAHRGTEAEPPASASHDPPSSWSRQALVDGCRRGERGAFEALIAEFQPRLFFYIRRLMPGEADAWDALQQTWLRVIRKIDQLVDAEKLPAWLYAAARSAALNHRRALATRQALVSFTDEPPEPVTQPEPALERMEDAEAVHAALARLSVPHREVLTLFFLQDLSVDQIAEVTAVPPGTVKSRLHHARNALRKVLSEPDTPDAPPPDPKPRIAPQ